MASKAKSPDVVVDQVLELDPATIEISDEGRIGFFFPEKAEAYAVLLARDGQRDPIKVRRNGSRAKFAWTLVAGRHRQRCSPRSGRSRQGCGQERCRRAACERGSLYGSDTNDFGTAVQVGPDRVAGLGAEVTVNEVSLPAGTRYYWARAFKAGSGSSILTGPVSATIT